MTDDLPQRLSEDLERAFPGVVATYQHTVFTTAQRMSDRPEDAADAAAEVFLRAYSALRGYPAERIDQLQLLALAGDVALNLIRNDARSASRRPVHVALAGEPPVHDGREGPAEHDQRHDGQARLGRATNLDYDLRGLGQFDRAVLAKTLEIPRGEVRPYAWIAREIGHRGAVRAAGSALGRNPVPILIPCHRVVRSDGASDNYGLGPEFKVELLRAEWVNLDESAQLGRRGVHYLGSGTTGVFCYPSCTHARRITPVHRVELANVARAVEAGYRPCRHCRPGWPLVG